MDKKVERIINLYNRLAEGETIRKADEASHFGVNERTIQRDIDDIRAYCAENDGSDRELIYDRAKKWLSAGSERKEESYKQRNPDSL